MIFSLSEDIGYLNFKFLIICRHTASFDIRISKYQDFENFEHSPMCFMYFRSPDKSMIWKIIFHISHPKHMLCALKRIALMGRFF